MSQGNPNKSKHHLPENPHTQSSNSDIISCLSRVRSTVKDSTKEAGPNIYGKFHLFYHIKTVILQGTKIETISSFKLSKNVD